VTDIQTFLDQYQHTTEEIADEVRRLIETPPERAFLKAALEVTDHAE